MSQSEEKSKPIPTRFDDDVIDTLERIHKATGISRSEIIRRAVRYGLEIAKSENSLNFLLGDPDETANVFEGLSSPTKKSPLVPRPGQKYGPRDSDSPERIMLNEDPRKGKTA